MRAEDRRRKGDYKRLLVLCVLSVCAVIGASAATWYADNGLGNNAFDGTSQVITNGHGPKRNIANTIAAASSGEVVSVATGYYQESQWTPGTKTLTFPSGPVTLVNYDPGQTDSDGDGIPDWWQLWYYGTTTTNSFSCASCVDTNPWAHGLTNLQVYENPSVLNANDYSTIGDGIPDWWRVKYFGGGATTNTNSCASCDPDGDGCGNLDEFLMGTNPNTTNDPITVYVDSMNTNGVWDGTQAHPFRYIQDAIECSVSVSSNLAIRVRPGNYYETVSNQQYDFDGNVLANRPFLYLYAANTNWSLSTDPESHIIDSSGLPNGDVLGNSAFGPTSAVEFFDVDQARINAFTIRGGAGVYGGGILAYSSTGGPIYISNCIIERNGSASTEGGGVFIQAGTNSLIYNSVVAKNSGDAGGIIDIYGSRIWNCTVVSNVSVQADVGAVTGDLGMPSVRNCVVWGNVLDLTFVDADYSTFESNEFTTVGAHNLAVDPQLVTTAFGNYRLQTNSTVRGTGTQSPIERRDLYGNSRPATGSFDIGANQYKDSLGSGMQDDWEIKHGLSLSVNQGSLDPDGDGLNNLQEYNHNTDPNNPDTDGDGIPDNLDPDPTTPDEVLTIEFHSFDRDAVWQYYINGVTDPTWINQPPSQPRIIKLKNYHIGDALSLQMRYLSGPLDALLFLVPLQSKGAFTVMAAADDTPVGQFTSSAALGDLTPPAPGWKVTVWQAIPTNSTVCQGYDDESPQFKVYGQPMPALSVPQSGTNTFTATINAGNLWTQVVFQVANTNLASVTPTTPSAPTQLVSVVGLAMSNVITSTTLNIVGPGAQNSWSPVGTNVTIDILPKKTNVTVAIWAVTAKGEPSTTPTNAPTQASLSNYLNQVYGKQANVFMNVLPLVSTNVNYDLNTNGVLEVETADATKASAEEAVITNAVFRSGTINIYYVRSISASNSAVALASPPLGYAVVQDFHGVESTVNVTAHEIGHMLGLDDVGGPGQKPGNDDRLMGPSSLDPCRLVRDEWTNVNKNASNPLPR